MIFQERIKLAITCGTYYDHGDKLLTYFKSLNLMKGNA